MVKQGAAIDARIIGPNIKPADLPRWSSREYLQPNSIVCPYFFQSKKIFQYLNLTTAGIGLGVSLNSGCGSV